MIGVVIAQLSKLAFAEETGTLPENINYAVTGEELLTFLAEEGVGLPRAEGAPVELDNGIPESMQRAVVPVICEGGG